MPFWERTKVAVDELEQKLKCDICHGLMKDPYSVKTCDHSFCRPCITKAVNDESRCPECGSFAWVKDLQVNRELAGTIEFCLGLKNALLQHSVQDTNLVDEPKPEAFKEKNSVSDTVKDICSSPSWPMSGIQAKKPKKTYARKVKASSTHAKDTSAAAKSVTDFSANKVFDVYSDDCVLDVQENFFREESTADQEEVASEKSPNAQMTLSSKPTQPEAKVNQTIGNTNLRNRSSSKKTDVGLTTSHAKAKGDNARRSALRSNASTRESSRNLPSVMKVNKKGETPLHVAAIKGKYDQVQELLAKGADPNAKDFAGWTPLHEACNHGCLEIVQLLLDNGAHIDVPGCDHDTPLHDAIANNRLEVAEFLISRGASLDVRNKQGLLPMDYVRSTAVKGQLMMAATMAQENREANNPLILSGNLKPNHDLPKSILHTGLDQKEKQMLARCTKSLGGEMVDEFNSEVSHVVTAVDDQLLCSRSVKFLHGVLTGKWIVSPQWVRESLRKHRWVDEEPYEVRGCRESSESAPMKARLNALKQFPPLFDGCSFYFSGDFRSAPSKPDLISLVESGGGTVLHREPKPETSHPLITPSSPAVMKMMSLKELESPTVAYHAKPDTSQSHCTQFVIFDAAACPTHKRLSTPIMCTAPSTWILDCIAQFELVEVKDV